MLNFPGKLLGIVIYHGTLKLGIMIYHGTQDQHFMLSSLRLVATVGGINGNLDFMQNLRNYPAKMNIFMAPKCNNFYFCGP